MGSIEAISVLKDSDSVVSAGRQIAATAVAQLDRGEAVEISLLHVRGLTSSFFNILFADIIRVHGSDIFDNNRVQVFYSSGLQRQTAIRSLESVKRSILSGDDPVEG